MSTIHLVYSSLEHVLDNPYNRFDVKLVIRNSKIKPILNECSLFPTVIDDIICDYIVARKIKYNSHARGDFSASESIFYVIFAIELMGVTAEVRISCSPDFSKITYDLDILVAKNIIMKDLNKMYRQSEGIQRLNAYMEHMHDKKNYIVCSAVQYNEDDVFFMKDNTILHMTNRFVHGAQVLNHKKFKCFVVIMKCIVNGVQRYFRENDIKDYFM